MYKSIAGRFPKNICYAFAYGSGVKPQIGYENTSGCSKMIDVILCVNNPVAWHDENLKSNGKDYSALRLFGSGFLTYFQQNFGANIYFNTLVQLDEKTTMKYGVISPENLVEDLLEWKHLYVAGRLHKPVVDIFPCADNKVKTALNKNLRSAFRTALLLLPTSTPTTKIFGGGGCGRISGKMSGSDFAYEKLCEKMENTKQCDQESREVYGPILPPHLLEKADRVSKADLGSSIPSHLQDSNTFETTIQANILDDSTEDMIGPLPITKSDPLTETQLKLEQRALEIKLQGLENEKNTKKETSREDWMLTLPEVMSSKSLYPTNRKFRTTDGPDFSDRSCWTDIPGKKSYNQDVKVSKTDIKEEEIKQHQLLQRPKKKKQPEKSLLEIHQEKLKAKKAKHPGELERRPFNREIDLQNGRSNPANIKSLIQKAQYLDGKFGSGQGKYL